MAPDSWSYCVSIQFSRSVVSDSATPWTEAHQASLSMTNSQSLLKLMPAESVMSSHHLILCHPLLLLLSIFPSIRVFSSESVLCIKWSKYWSFGFSISPSNEYSGLISLGWTGEWTLRMRLLISPGTLDSSLCFIYPRILHNVLCFPCGSTGKESACNAGDLGSIPGLGRSLGEAKGYPFQNSGQGRKG